MKKQKKHKKCSYMTPSPDGRKKTTIKMQQNKDVAMADAAYIEKMSRCVNYFLSYM